MLSMRNSILRHMRIRSYLASGLIVENGYPCGSLARYLHSLTSTNPDILMERVVGLVTKYAKMDSCKVTETADFQKDLHLDSLDRFELVMALEQEFYIEIPDEQADKITCCADIVKYILSKDDQHAAKTS